MHTPALQRSRTKPSPVGRRALACVLAVLFLFGASPQAPALTAEEQQLANLLTGDRGQRRDRSRMRPDPILCSVARARAEDMAARRYFSHVNPDGLGPNALVRAAGYALPSSWRGRSENFIESIGAGYATAEAAWEGWMNSSSHRTHLLASSSFYRDQTSFGIGSYSDPSSPYRRYWVIITAPPSRGDSVLASRNRGKAARIAILSPVWNSDDVEEPRSNTGESIPRPTATRIPAPDRLWNWKEPVYAPRPRATRMNGAG